MYESVEKMSFWEWRSLQKAWCEPAVGPILQQLIVTTGDRQAQPIVLAVDDDPGFLETLDVILSGDFTLLAEQSGPQALELVRKHRVDVILLDLVMPEMDGFEVLKRLRAARSTIPVIIVTAYKDVDRVVRGMKAGAYDYVTKPWDDDDDLIELIRAAERDRAERTAVLCVSDDPAALAPLEVALQAQTKVVACTPQHAAAMGIQPDIVVIDSPLAAIDEMKSILAVRARFWDVPLVLITSGAHGEDRLTDIAALAPTAIFVKPYPLDEMLGCLAGLLAARGRLVRGWPRFGPQLERAIDTLARRYSDPLTVHELARVAALSTDRLVHAFREALGMSPKAFAKRLRVAVASRLLRETDLKLEEIGSRTGFSDGSHLSRTFEEATGVRPGEYRRKPTGF
jgi:DNA-binding response OmpR family regulator